MYRFSVNNEFLNTDNIKKGILIQYERNRNIHIFNLLNRRGQARTRAERKKRMKCKHMLPLIVFPLIRRKIRYIMIKK